MKKASVCSDVTTQTRKNMIKYFYDVSENEPYYEKNERSKMTKEIIDWNILPGRRVHIMKEKIIKLLDRADYRKLELIYRIVKKIVGAED